MPKVAWPLSAAALRICGSGWCRCCHTSFCILTGFTFFLELTNAFFNIVEDVGPPFGLWLVVVLRLVLVEIAVLVIHGLLHFVVESPYYIIGNM